MASIREYFDRAFDHVLTATRAVTLQTPSGELESVVQVHFDFDAPARYFSIFIPSHETWREVCEVLLRELAPFLEPTGQVNIRLPQASLVFGGFKITNGPPAVQIEAHPLCESPIKGSDLPFSGTVFVYSEKEASPLELGVLKAFALQRGFRLRWRGPAFARERSLIEKPAAFISHDTRDKQEVARPMAIKFGQMLCPVWFDEFSLQVGDSLRGKIEKGLKECAKCILVLSPNFLNNGGWTKAEFDSVFTREIIEKKDVMLPVWCGITQKEVYEYSPRLADKVGVNWDLGLEEVCRRLYRSIASTTALPTKSVWHGE